MPDSAGSTNAGSLDDIAGRSGRDSTAANAAQGLKQHVELREKLACIPDSPNWTNAESLLRQWVQEAPSPISLGVLFWSVLIGTISIPVIALVMFDVISIRWLLLMVILQTPAVLLTRQQIRATASRMDNVDSALRQFGQVIAVFESASVDEPAVRDLLNRFHCAEGTASKAITALGS